jgi:hypothetical protein
MAVAALLLTTAALPLQAQTQPARAFGSGMRFGAGYAGAIPEALVGVGAITFFGDSRVGAFADWKMTLPSITNDDIYCPEGINPCTVAFVNGERNDQEVRIVDEWLAFNAGVMYAITPEFAFMGGGGIVRQSTYREFFHSEADPAQRITETGGYYVDDEDEGGWVPQAVVGLLLRAGNRLAFRFGYETAPGGMSLGAYIIP